MIITTRLSTPMQNDGLPTIVNAFEHSTALRLYAADILTNHARLEQYHPAATAGECVPCVYVEAGIANAFFELLAQTASNGQDMSYQPQLRINNPGNALLFTHDEAAHKDGNAIIKLIPEAMPFDELLCSIATAIEQTGSKLVIIDDVQAYAKQTNRPIFWDLNELAYYQNAIILAGFRLAADGDEDEETSSYLATHAHNLWQLTGHSLNMLNDDGESTAQPYFCFSYGSNLEPKRAYFGLDSEGKACMPRDLIKLLRIQELARTFAPRWVKQSLFANICYGATAGEFNKDSFVKAVEIATLNGYIAKSGSGNHTKLMYADSPLSKTINAGNIAITAVTNQYVTGKRQRKAILKFGEFKIVTAESGTSEFEMQKFAQGMMGCILSGKKWLNFEVKTSYKNVLAIAVTNATQRAKEWLMQGMGKDIATFNIQTIPTGTADGDFLTAFKQATNTAKPDFVFVIGLDRIQPTKYTWQLLLREMKTYSKTKGICTLAFSGKPQEYFGDISRDEHWTISPLVREDERTAIHNAHGIVLPPIKLFQGYAGNLECQCRFGHGKQSKLVSVSTAEAKRAFLVGTFYWCNETDGHDIETDCTGHQLTNSAIWQAKKEGIISLKPYGKAMIDSKITFKGYAGNHTE